MMFGKQLLPVLGALNAAFGGSHPRVTAEHSAAFAPGASLGPALVSVLNPAHAELNELLGAYVETIPKGMQSALLSIIYYALTSERQVLLNFSWAPSYDFELTIWELVEPAPAHSGINILLKGRYPDDPSPVAEGRAP